MVLLLEDDVDELFVCSWTDTVVEETVVGTSVVATCDATRGAEGSYVVVTMIPSAIIEAIINGMSALLLFT